MLVPPKPLNPGFLQQIQGKSLLAEQGYLAGLDAAVPRLDPAGLLFAGMGGSGATAMLVRDAASRVLGTPFTLVQHYNLPNHVKPDWHVLAVSYSGQTEETLSTVRQAMRRGCRVTAFSTGGELAAMAGRNVPQPEGHQPRVALAHTWFSVLGFLEGSGLLGAERVPIKAAVAAIREVDAACGPGVPEERNEARQLARRLQGKIPQVYTTPAFAGLGVFFASLMNENAKRICDVDEIPEMNHNAFTGWSGDPLRTHFTALVLSHGAQNPELARRIEFMRGRYEAWGVPWHHRVFAPIQTFADHVVEQARALQLLDYTSYYAAELGGVDPAQIDDVRALKAHLRQAPPASEDPVRPLTGPLGKLAPEVDPQYLL
ncbi:MAG TPA: SIS domain-containing protein [Candidatus Thermoplasmatota archaeon]|nr:SIS domain-containing protein [Candidatus Thermoplasmatota archaeon]